jgi:hypothetical protein
MKLIFLTAIITTPNEAGEEKIEKATKVRNEEPRINYESLGIKPPKGEIELNEDGEVILEDEDFEEVGVPVSIPLDSISSYVALLEGGSLVYTKNNVSYTVEEDVWMIDSYIELLTMSWIEIQWYSFLVFWRKITNKKQVRLEDILSRPENQINK